MTDFQFTEYFEEKSSASVPTSRKEWCIRVVQSPTRMERQEPNRWRFWAPIPEFGGRYLRVVTLDDQHTIHNAFPDREFKP